MRRILILCANSWGQAGNRNSALRLAALLKPRLTDDAQIVVQSAEDWLPLVASIGTQMRALAVVSGDAVEREQRYRACIAAVEGHFPAGFEFERSDDDVAVATLAERVNDFAPDIVIGTKGFLSRLLHAARIRFGFSAPIVNYVTNDGLLALALHRTDAAILNLVQTDFGRRAIGRDGRIVTVGPLVAIAPSHATVEDDDPRPLVAVLCNGNPEYRALFDKLLQCGDTIRVNAVIMGCPALLDDIRAIAPRHWQVWDAQAATRYLELLADVAAARRAILVTKSAPGSLFEAVAAGIPVLAVRSGLPMENWTLDLVAENGLGWVAADIATAIARIDDLIARPAAIDTMTETTRAFAGRAIDNERTLTRISQAMRDEIAAQTSSRGELHDGPVRLRFAG